MRESYYKRYFKRLLEGMGDDPFNDPMKGELCYSNIGHKAGDWLWAAGDGKFMKREVKTGKETHFNLGLLYQYEFFGRYDRKKNAVTITNLGYGEDVPEGLIDRLKYEFGDSIRIKQFRE